MPKAGSSSVQQWLGSNSVALQAQSFTVAVSHWNEAEEVAFTPYEEGGVNSDWIIDCAVKRSDSARRALIDAFIDGLASAAEQHGNIIVSSESFSTPFWSAYSPMLTGLQRLAMRYEVRVAYYARPQHSSLEASWRQWGYRTGLPPSTYVSNCSRSLHYASTRRMVNSVAPDLAFEPTPFRADLLESGDVVVDFARRFLGLQVIDPSEPANRGLPLEVVNILRMAPPGMFWDSPHDNDRLERIKHLYVGQRFPDDDFIDLSRRVLHKYAFDRFAAENAELGWDDLVPPPDDDDEELPGIDALDRLWTPRASPVELRALFQALQAAIAS